MHIQIFSSRLPKTKLNLHWYDSSPYSDRTCLAGLVASCPPNAVEYIKRDSEGDVVPTPVFTSSIRQGLGVMLNVLRKWRHQ
jgi:hypothetical protein